MMTKIYSLASQARLWLGPAADNSEMVMELFENTSGTSVSFREEKTNLTFVEYVATGLAVLTGWRVDPQPMQKRKLGEHLMDEKQNRLRRALEAFIERDYWYRAWVVQEILVAKQISLTCGSRSVSWKCVTNVVGEFVGERRQRIHYPQGSLRRPSPRTREMNPTSLETIGHLASFRISGPQERGPLWFLDMLLKLRHFKSRDPREKIFSLLGLVDMEHMAEEPDISVNYDLSFVQVSTKLFKSFIMPKLEYQRGSLNILSASRPSNRSEGFPSWLPGFSKDNGMEHWPFRDSQYPRFDDPIPSISSEGSILKVTAVQVTTLKRDCVTSRDDDAEATDNPCLLTRIQTFMLLAAKKNPPALASRSFWSVLELESGEGQNILRYLSANPDRRALEHAPPRLLLQILENGFKEQDSPVISFLDKFRRRSLHRRFAVVSIEGDVHLAMVPADSRPGDTILLLGRCSYPVVLRAKDDNHAHFEFVGPCCIPSWRGAHKYRKPVTAVETISLC